MARTRLTVSLSGFEALQRAFATAPALVQARAKVAVTTTVATIASRARALVPRDSGALHRAIAWEVDDLAGAVGVDTVDVFYWVFIEFGTKYKAARPFFRPAAEMESDPFLQRMRAIGDDLDRAFTLGRAA